MINGKPKSSSREHHSSRAYWIQSVQNRPSSAGRLTGAAKFSANVPRGHDANEYFANILRKNLGANSNGTGTLDVHTARPEEVPFLSTTCYLREQFGMIPNGLCTKPDFKLPPGTPNYKTPEEYYDEVLDLRKQVTEILGENSILKAKQHRLEDELVKKDKELLQAFEKKSEKGDNGKSTDSPGRADKNTMVQNLKIRLFKLEQKYKTRDGEYRRLEAEMKKTDIDELRHQLEICLGQIATLRYHNAKIMSGQMSDRSSEMTVQEVVSAKPIEEYEPSSSETESFSSDSETGYQGHRSRSSRSRSISAVRLLKAPEITSPQQPKPTPISLPEPVPVPVVKEERPSSSDRPKCTLKEHQNFEEILQERKELRDTMRELEKRREEMAKDGKVRSNQKVPLQGKAYELLLALDKQETLLLKQLNEVTGENEELKEKMKNLDAELVKLKSQTETDAAAEMQALLRAHQVRVTDSGQLQQATDIANRAQSETDVASEMQSLLRAHRTRITDKEQLQFDNMDDDSDDNSNVVNLQSILRAHMERRSTYERLMDTPAT